MKFMRRSRRQFDIEALQAAVEIFITAQEIVVDNASYPTADIARNSHDLPHPRPRLRQPGRAADGPGPALRQRGGPRLAAAP
jgi:hypothetical protein